jgi:hypothetical protein
MRPDSKVKNKRKSKSLNAWSQYQILHVSSERPVDACYGSILTVNFIRELGELVFLACIFIYNNIISTCLLENNAMQWFELKWRENVHLNLRQKLSTNQNTLFSLTWIKEPTKACNRLSTAPVHTRQTQGPTRQSPCQRRRGKAAWLDRPNRSRHNRLTSSTCCPLIGSQWCFQVTPLICRPRDPCATPIIWGEGG